jgi:DNA-binding response OmpR family regulator
MFRGGHMPDKRILLVEDDEGVGALLTVALEGDG